MNRFYFLKKAAVSAMAGLLCLSIFLVPVNANAVGNGADNGKKAKYVFLFIGDGMGFSHIALTEAYLATEKGQLPGSIPLGFTQFPVMGMATTYSASNIITCSSAAGTALSTGFKTKNHMLGMNPDTIALESISYKIHRAGYKVGIMTSVTIDHATPGAFYGHSPKRSDYYSIARELPLTGFEFFGGGGFEGAKDERNKDNSIYKSIADNGYVVSYGLNDYKSKKEGADKMILFQEKERANEILKTNWERDNNALTLPQVVSSAIEFLDNDKGFFIMAEGGQIDWAAHAHDIPGTIFETIDFDNAIKVAYDFYLKHPDETLIVVTADHETGGVTLGKTKGYFFDLTPVLKGRKAHLAKINGEQTGETELSDKESGRTVENYMSGITNDSLSVVTRIGWTTTSHTGGAVPVFAIGVGAENFAGRMNNIDIPKRICKVMGIPFANKVEWYYPRMAEFKKEKPICSKDIVFLGNSITYGARDIAKYFPKAAENLAAKGGRLVNRGIVGESTKHLYERLDEILVGKPAKLFIMGGINDLAGGVTGSEICSRLERIVKAVKEASPKTKIYVESLLPINESFNAYKSLNGKTAEVAKVNALIERMAKEEKVQFVNLYPHFLESGTDNLNPQITKDGLHLTKDGYAIWASQLVKYVR